MAIRSRFLNCKVRVQLMGEEYPWEGTISQLVKEGPECVLYELSFDDGSSQPAYFSLDDVSWIQIQSLPVGKSQKPKQKAKVIPLKLVK